VSRFDWGCGKIGWNRERGGAVEHGFDRSSSIDSKGGAVVMGCIDKGAIPVHTAHSAVTCLSEGAL
jgi:hypothetical protein